MKNFVWDIVVIGGGPAGMMAAGRAAEIGKHVLLLEKNSSLGRKLLITGGGRCNVTNNKPEVRTMLSKYKGNDQFLFSAFTQFGVKEAIDFFKNRGMNMKEENEGRMFPITDKAKTVWDVLVEYMKEGGVNIESNSIVTSIQYDEKTKIVSVILKDKSIIRAKSCVVATGGASRPETGSTGDGFKWLKDLGHKVVENDVSLVPIALKDDWVKKISGVSLGDIKLTTFKNNKKQKIYKGKILFTHVGITGPTVLNMSRDVGELVGEGYEENGVTIMLDLFPSLDIVEVKQKIQEILIENSNKKIKNSLSLFIPSALVSPILNLVGIDEETPNHSVRTEDRKKLISIIKAVPLNVLGLLGKDKAIVSSGGVTLDEVNLKTMQSKVIASIYLVGDVLNIDRPSGGYSLQLCWTTGYVAGSNC